VRLSAHGITTDLPAGWEGRITRRRRPTPVVASGPAEPDGAATRAAGPVGSPEEVPGPVVHLANFALPEDRGDFGSGAVDRMGSGHLFVTLFEYGPESVGKALFAHQGIPALRSRMFSSAALQRTIAGQAGCQRWFTAAGRAFCLYVVLGRVGEASALVPKANTVLRATAIDPR
jgi:hypothetical protein